LRLGRRREGQWLQLVAAPARSEPGRVGFVIGRKTLKSAVDRNRVKRVLRVVVDRARPGVTAFDLILRLKRAASPAEVPAVAREAERLLAALGDDAERGGQA
jgi:ribonuclease P protein component